MPFNQPLLGPVYQLSPVDVTNNALDQIGQNPIENFEEGSGAANAAKRYFPSCLRAMLREHKWNFAYNRVYLPELSQQQIIEILGGFGGGGFGGGGFGGSQEDIVITAVGGPYSRWFATPNDMIRAWRINGNDRNAFAIEGRILKTDESGPCLLEYEQYVDDVNVWDGMFQAAFESYLASRLCMRLTKDLKLGQQLYSVYLVQLDQAKQADGQEGTPERLQVDTFIRIRE